MEAWKYAGTELEEEMIDLINSGSKEQYSAIGKRV